VSEPTSALPPKRPSPEPPPSSEPVPADDRAVRALTDFLGESRPRVPLDGTDPDIPVAATVMLLRDGAAGPEVLMIERPDRGSFAGAWVFPGGKLDDSDRAADDEPEEDAARRAAVRETWEETGLVVEPGRLRAVSCWDPPPGIALRIRTWFFAVRAGDEEPVLADDEAVAAAWVDPAQMLERHGRGEVLLYPPTWVTLHGLTGQPDVEALLGALELAGFRRFETVARKGIGGPLLLWQEDAEYDGAGGDAASRHRLEIGALPWVYTRTG
jgi:8-oxo-dGTP pyrophosphatase MutT (NUDIX family)